MSVTEPRPWIWRKITVTPAIISEVEGEKPTTETAPEHSYMRLDLPGHKHVILQMTDKLDEDSRSLADVPKMKAENIRLTKQRDALAKALNMVRREVPLDVLRYPMRKKGEALTKDTPKMRDLIDDALATLEDKS